MLTDLVNFNFQEKQERQQAERKRIIMLSIYFLKVFQAVVWKRVLTCLVNFDFQEKQEREEAERKRRIQLYVFVLRCIAYPFNCKQPLDLSKRHLKITRDGLEKMKAKIEVRRLYNLSNSSPTNPLFQGHPTTF